MRVGPSVWGPSSCEGLLCSCCIGVVNLTFSFKQNPCFLSKHNSHTLTRLLLITRIHFQNTSLTFLATYSLFETLTQHKHIFTHSLILPTVRNHHTAHTHTFVFAQTLHYHSLSSTHTHSNTSHTYSSLAEPTQYTHTHPSFSLFSLLPLNTQTGHLKHTHTSHVNIYIFISLFSS
jgi:hypothetical protein